MAARRKRTARKRGVKEPYRVLVTGGCGFIGSNLIRYLLRHRSGWEVVNLDLLTYAG
ncbi:MAG: NAD-dependent epimerase/dehydratase family protein, partial [Acidobacteria bacterium]